MIPYNEATTGATQTTRKAHFGRSAAARRMTAMSYDLFQRVLTSEPVARAVEHLKTGDELNLAGVWGSAGPLIAAAVGRAANRPVLYLAPHLDDADGVADDMELFTSQPVATFPAWEAQLASDHVSEEVTAERLAVLEALAANGADGTDIIVAPVLAMLQPVPTADALAAGRRELLRGQSVAMDELLAWLADGGYEPLEQVDRPGQFAHRGGIVDIFPPTARTAIRVEFFGDVIDSIRQIDLDTQRSVEQLDCCDLLAVSVGQSLETLADDDRPSPVPCTHLLDYLPPETLIVRPDPYDLRDLADELYDRIRDDLADERSPVALRRVEDVFGAMDRFARAGLHLFAGQRHNECRMGVRSLERLAVNTAEALDELEQLAEIVDVWVFCENPAERDRFGDHLAQRYPTLAERGTLAIGHLNGGFHWPDAGFAAVGHSEIYHRYAKVRRVRRVRTGRPIQSMLDLREGDYVVHVGHGIAKFDGLKHLQRDEGTEEYLRLVFADNAVLHVPASQIDLVQKYVGARGKRPRLSKLGGKHWARTRQRVSEAVEDLAAELLRVQAMRQAQEGFGYPAGTDLQRQLAESFVYTETEDQLAALQQIDADMAAAQPMDRLICGDVGYGKTELAIRAAFKVVEAGRQVGVLVPTTVLAEQHFRTFRERLADYPVNVEMISRFRTAAQQEAILQRLADGRVDILIGTHRLLSKDVRFADLGLVVIDEEQRFGVTAKEHLKQMRAMVDVLTLTATPIPRTLHMALLGLRDISSLQTPPMDRRAIHTEVVPADDELIRTAILRELNRGGQVFFVHNRVHNIESLRAHLQGLVGEARIAVGHGQMGERGLERVMVRFVEGQIDVLVCTTIIESGLDIPTANTMLVNEADRFGLAELHQLRGRVGRSQRRAYCYLLLPKRRTVNPVAAKRLKAIEDFSDLGAGFQIAMRDLEIRGAGNILGPQQSGHIAMVGYELYCQLLDNSVRQLRGEEPRQPSQVHMDIGIDAYIPRSYIASERQRLEIYRRLVAADEPAAISQLRRDLDDAFGPLPDQVQTLLDAAEVRVRAGQCGIESILLIRPDLVFRISDHRRAEPVFTDAPGSVRLPDPQTLHWRPPRETLRMPALLMALLERFRQAAPSSN
jgi:transcription-repair coupling factor (superfamily II helicase)